MPAGPTGNGIALLAIYSLGLGVPFLLTALFTKHFLVHMKRLGRWNRTIHIGSAIILTLNGLAMTTGQLAPLSYRFLQMFLARGRIG